MLRWSLALLFLVTTGLLSHTDLGAAAKKKKKDPDKAGAELVVNGELTDNDDKDKVRKDSYCKIYTFKMTKGRTYQIDMKSKDLDSYLRLENPKGEQVAFDDDGGGFPDARIIYKADETGDFKIIATTFNGGATGKFTLTAKDKDAPAGGKAIELKNDKGMATYTGKLDKDDPLYKGKRHKLFTFEMEEGKTYQIDMKSGQLDSYLFLESPEGEVLAKDDDSGDGLDARIVHKAAKSGRFRIICTNFGGGLGEFTLTIRQTDKE
jgi:hypothetical protein